MNGENTHTYKDKFTIISDCVQTNTKMATNDDVALGQKYKKHNLRDHIYEIPGMYVGSVDITPMNVYVYNDESKRMQMRELHVVPALFKIVDEVVVNATDQWVRMRFEPKSDSKPVKTIKIYVDKVSGYIEVYNDGDSIDVQRLPEYDNVYVPEMIFGQLLTSTNYDKGKDGKESVVSGVHGLGVKLCNVFSKEFSIDLVDHRSKRHYVQTWKNNMLQKTEPEIKYCAKVPYTRVRFLPDYARFGIDGMTDDMFDLIRKRAFDACACTDNTVHIYFNDDKIDVKDFERYSDLFLGGKEETPRAYEKIGDRWEVIATYSSSSQFEHVSFVNGINTYMGGKHVDYITNQVTKKLGEMISSKKKKEVKSQHIKENLVVFVKCSIINPAFNSQTKETLTTPASKFGSKCELSDKFFTALFKTGIVEKVINLSAFHDEKKLTKTDGKKRSTILGIENLDDANWAGTTKSSDCTLILTEGLSAKTMAIAGLSVVGRDKWGVFPLRGKLMNVKDANLKKIYDNEEITNIKKILGLESGKVYTNVSELRYGRVMLMTDADADGSHIKGLAFNLFHSLWPSLVNAKGFQFMCSMLTPIVKAFKGKETKSFYSVSDFENWKESNEGRGWHVKYYKGLGTSTDDEAKEYFRDMRAVSYTWTIGDEKIPSPSQEMLDLAFNKTRADDRKEWLANYNRKVILDYKNPEVSYEDFVNKELIHFSNYDLERSIPNVCDGLKTSQRKILYCCFKKSLWEKEIRVAQLAAYVSENSAYHHGEASLQGAITAMAQNFVGSNNINLLAPNGQFGSRVIGGKDASQPRYIHTQLCPITGKIFIKDDAELLSYLEDDGFPVEPEYYMPILPMILVNGAVGIGTGFSTNIPCYNPTDIVNILRRMLNGEQIDPTTEEDLSPWYNGFTGTIEKQGNKWVSRGTFKRLSSTKVEITELPVGFWTADFKEMVESMICDKEGKNKNCPIKSYESHYTPTKVNFVLHFSSSSALDDWLVTDSNGYTKLENELKMTSSKNLSVSNMYAFNEKGQITKYDTALHIIQAFYDIRMNYYVKRKEHMLDKIKSDLLKLNNKIRFVMDVIQGVIVVHKLRKSELEDKLAEMEYDMYEDSYDYLTKIPIYNFTIDKVEELKDEINKKQVMFNTLESTTVQMMWTNDLDEFEKVCNNSYTGVDDMDIDYEPCTQPVKKSGQTRSKTSVAKSVAKKVTIKKKGT